MSSQFTQMNLNGEVAEMHPLTYERRSHSVAFPGQSIHSQDRIDKTLAMCRNAIARDGVLYREIMADARDIVRQELEEQVAIHVAVEEYCSQSRKRQHSVLGSIKAPINVDKFVAWIDLCVDLSTSA